MASANGLDLERQKLKDPVSAELLYQAMPSAGRVDIGYRAKNSFGAFRTISASCGIVSGKVSKRLTEAIGIGQEIEEVDKRLRAEIAAVEEGNRCMIQRREFVRAGDTFRVATSKLGDRCHAVIGN